jgi:Icc-related predicted phosphoesterase
MTDYQKIRRSSTHSKLRSRDTAVIHSHSLKWLHSELTEIQGNKTVVVSHHGPSPKSLPEKTKEEIVSSAYVSNLEIFISSYNPRYWVHGHLHNGCEYNVGECTVICNPKGYPEE